MDNSKLQKLYKIAKAIADTDSIGEGWLYNKRGYSWKQFLSEKQKTDLIRENPAKELCVFDQTYYNVALRIYREAIGDDCDEHILIIEQPEPVEPDLNVDEIVEE